MDGNKYKYKHSEVLQLIYDANKEALVNDAEKRKIKGKFKPSNYPNVRDYHDTRY